MERVSGFHTRSCSWLCHQAGHAGEGPQSFSGLPTRQQRRDWEVPRAAGSSPCRAGVSRAPLLPWERATGAPSLLGQMHTLPFWGTKSITALAPDIRCGGREGLNSSPFSSCSHLLLSCQLRSIIFLRRAGAGGFLIAVCKTIRPWPETETMQFPGQI